MPTDYDPIAEQYKLSKQQPWRTHIESHTLLGLVGDPTGKLVVDLACGEGFYTRRLKQLGARRVVGIDLSQRMIELAREQESQHLLGIEYRVGDACEVAIDEPADLVVAAYLLNYAPNRAALQAMCDGIARCLRPGGRFVTVNSSPLLDFCQAPTFRPYGFEITQAAGPREGAALCWKFFLSECEFAIENYFLDHAIHEEAFRRAGFSEVRWHAPRLTNEAAADPSQWSDFLTHSPVAFIECVK